LLDAIAAGELHLTGLLMLGPHLTEANLAEVMARAKHRTKREITRLVRVLDPLPPVPARIEPLGSAPARVVPLEPTWEPFVGAMSPVRELDEGERPRDWGLGDAERGLGDAERGSNDEQRASVAPLGDGWEDVTPTAPTDSEACHSPAPARIETGPCDGLTVPQRYKVQFTATEEYVRLVDQAKALLSHVAPRATLEDVQLRAMRALVGALRKRKYGAEAPESDAVEKVPRSLPREPHRVRIAADGCPSPRSSAESPAAVSSLAEPNDSRAERNDSVKPDDSVTPSQPRWRGRHIPVAVRRAVAARDGERCTYVDACGRRCSETRHLEFHHRVPFAVSAAHEPSNLTLRCAAHNALAAEQDFGRDLVREKKTAARHDSFRDQAR
jgi:hypothetical protein